MKAALLISFAFSLSRCLASIAPKAAQSGQITKATQAKGRALLQKAAEAQGLTRWQTVKTIEIVMEDRWQGFIASMANPWPKSDVTVKAVFRHGTFDSRLTFMNDPELNGITWGIQSMKIYTEVAGKPPVFEEDDDIEFMLPTIQYFLEFPERALTAQLVAYAGTKTLSGVTYDRVLITWGSFEANDKYDQYVAYINPTTSRIDKLHYTVRDFAGFVEGVMHYDDYRNIDGAWIPFSQTVTAELEDEMKDRMHRIKIKSAQFDTVPVSIFKIDPKLANLGDSKQ